MINKKIYNTLPVFKKNNKKYQLGGMSAEETKKIKDRTKEIRDTEAERMKDESIKTTIVASNNSPIISSTSSTTPVTTAPTSNKTVVRLEEDGTNDYYEVDVDAAGKPIFSTKTKLTTTQKKDYNSKYVFTEPTTTTNVPTLAVPPSITTAPKIANTGTESKNKPSVKKVTQKPKPKSSPKVTAKTDSSNTATDTSRISAMLSDSLGVKPDTSATWQKPAPKKVVSIVPPSLNQSDNVYDKSEAANAKRQEGKKDVNKGDKLIKPQPDTWDRWIDRGQADIGAASLGASLTGVGTPIAKAVDAVSTGVDAAQLAAAIRRGDVPEQWNQGIQVGARFLVPAAGRVAGSAIRKVMPEISGEVGKNIGKRFMNKVDNSMPYLGKETLAKSTQAAQTALKDRSENLASMSIKEAEDIMVNADAYPDKEFVKRVAKHLQDSKAKIQGKYVASKPVILKKPTEMTMKEAEDIMINPENYPASYVKEIGKHLTETKSKLKLGYKAPTSVPTPKSSEPVLKPKISTKVSDQSSADRYSLQKAQISKPKPDINSTSLKPTPKAYNTKPTNSNTTTKSKEVVTAYPKYTLRYPTTKKQFGGYYFM